MHRYSKRPIYRLLRFVALWIHALLPFLWPIRGLFRDLRYFSGPVLYWRDYVRFRAKNKDPRFPMSWVDSYPCLFDRYDLAGSKPRHYFHQDLWAAKKVRQSDVREHFDFGSRIDGFVAHCAAFCQITVLDIRQLPDLDENIRFKQGDITNLTSVPTGSLHSVSSLHVFEHLGLGRYGDPIGSDSLTRAVNELCRVLAPGGSLYFSVPIGIQRMEFNAQRVFAVNTVLEMFSSLKLVEFSAITDADALILNAAPDQFDQAEYSCGLFHFVRTGPPRC